MSQASFLFTQLQRLMNDSKDLHLHLIVLHFHTKETKVLYHGTHVRLKSHPGINQAQSKVLHNPKIDFILQN